MTTIQSSGPFYEGVNQNDFILWEQPDYSREARKIKAGSGLHLAGTPMAMITAEKLYVPFDPTASDGSEIITGVLLTGCDATGTADVEAVTLERLARVAGPALQWGANVTTQAEKDAAILGLTALGIVCRSLV